uniref:2,3-bisphosphoglycerate-independent phosphoglycerate mutase n=1 Tax=Polysiphonia sertularioides TaxID=945028 RepID=A0A1Z1M9I8_9FLOR|nr:phosphoglycerate mutase [Polysiphonia sertularioides]ARW62435.1 phosphoglycerate mutase [Polysiphonia sertularioides]
MKNQNTKPLVLVILDGWGYSEKIEGNAIKLASTPNIDKILRKHNLSLLNASGKHVGLPKNQMGNSEVGHTTIGAGRIINQELVRIEKSIKTKAFFTNRVLEELYQKVYKEKSKLHVIGLCSDGGVHSHINHLIAIITMIQKQKNKIPVNLHLITDGRDTEAAIALKFLNILEENIENDKNINISSISGRYYSMDRDCRWSRTEKTYNMLTQKKKDFITQDYNSVITNFYSKGIFDEFIPPTQINNSSIESNDGILFFNFRPDRMRQLIQSLAKPLFKGFAIKEIKNLSFATFTEYDSSIEIPVMFKPTNYTNFLGEIISKNNIKQLRLAETEKYAHVTYFLNGGREEPFPGEDRELIPSPKVSTYDLQPEMSAYKITNSLIKALNKDLYQVIIVNYSNPDMVGHTGKLKPTIKAIEVVDECIGVISNEINKKKGILIITADHGNAEYMIDKNGKECKSHSTNMVPFIIAEELNENKYDLISKGSLADISPTILDILNIYIPEEMNGKSLLNRK